MFADGPTYAETSWYDLGTLVVGSVFDSVGMSTLSAPKKAYSQKSEKEETRREAGFRRTKRSLPCLLTGMLCRRAVYWKAEPSDRLFQCLFRRPFILVSF